MIWIFWFAVLWKKSNEELNISVERVSSSLSSLLHSYYWPGNIRELANTVESAMNMTQDGEDTLDVHHLPSYLKNHFVPWWGNMKKNILEIALASTGGNLTRCRGKVGHHPPGVDEKVQKYHIDWPAYKRRRQT